MLARITDALVKFLTPTASAAGGSADQNRQEPQEFQQFTPKMQPESLSHSADNASKDQRDLKPALKLVESPPTPELPKITDSLVYLVTALKHCKGPLTRPIGIAAYRLAVHRQKKSTKIRKGAIFDYTAN